MSRFEILFKIFCWDDETLYTPRDVGTLSSTAVQVVVMETEVIETDYQDLNELDKAIVRARRTAFVARFIVLREGKRTRAHRVIEMMDWDDLATVEELCERFRNAFIENGDNMVPVERDLRRAVAHSQRSLKFFVSEYSARSTFSFIESLQDYARSNELLFGAEEEEQPKPGGWRLPQELIKLKEQERLGLNTKPKKKTTTKSLKTELSGEISP
jgi:hypothetical protein